MNIGDPYTFRVNLGGNYLGLDGKPIARELHGRIAYINREHRYFLVTADVGGGVVIRECFKF